MKTYFLFFLIVCYLMVIPAGFCNAQMHLPETMGDLKDFFQKLMAAIFTVFPDALKKSWNDAYVIFKKCFDALKYIWDNFLWGRAEKILNFFIYQIKYRISIFGQEFKKELQELLDEIINLIKHPSA